MPQQALKPSLKLADIKAGDVLYPDEGFECLKFNRRVTVRTDDGGKYVSCTDGNHYLEGQLDHDDQETIVGLSRTPYPTGVTNGV